VQWPPQRPTAALRHRSRSSRRRSSGSLCKHHIVNAGLFTTNLDQRSPAPSSWPPRATTSAGLTRRTITGPAAKSVIIRQDSLPVRGDVAGNKRANFVTPASKTVITIGVDKYNRLSMQWPPAQHHSMGSQCSNPPAATTVVERQDMLPTRERVAGIRKGVGATTPASKVVIKEQSEVQWPPQRPTAALRVPAGVSHGLRVPAGVSRGLRVPAGVSHGRVPPAGSMTITHHSKISEKCLHPTAEVACCP